jgi:hypothetical protein
MAAYNQTVARIQTKSVATNTVICPIVGRRRAPVQLGHRRRSFWAVDVRLAHKVDDICDDSATRPPTITFEVLMATILRLVEPRECDRAGHWGGGWQ